MCCGLAILGLLGPRAAVIFWWLLRPGYFATTFDTILWPLLGIIFLPWTMIMYLLVAPGGVTGFEWVFIAIGVALDIATYSGSAYGNKDMITPKSS